MFKIQVDTSRITVTNPDNEMLVSGSINVNFVEFSFSEDWTPLQKTVIFQTKRTAIPILLDEETTILPIPWECLAVSGETISVGVYGISEDDPETEDDELKVLPTLWGSLGKVSAGVAVPNVPGPYPTPDAYLQLIELIKDLMANGGGGGTGGTLNHDLLRNRDLADQHPILAITGLNEVIENQNVSLQTLTELVSELKKRMDDLVSGVNASFDSMADDIIDLDERVKTLENVEPIVPETPITNHNDLDGRSDEDAHPISAITGLQDILDGIGSGGSGEAPATVAGIPFGICETDADTPDKTVSIPGITAQTDGLTILVYFKNGFSDASNDLLSLSVNGLTKRYMYRSGTAVKGTTFVTGRRFYLLLSYGYPSYPITSSNGSKCWNLVNDPLTITPSEVANLYLPLSGGEMTGPIQIGSKSPLMSIGTSYRTIVLGGQGTDEAFLGGNGVAMYMGRSSSLAELNGAARILLRGIARATHNYDAVPKDQLDESIANCFKIDPDTGHISSAARTSRKYTQNTISVGPSGLIGSEEPTETPAYPYAFRLMRGNSGAIGMGVFSGTATANPTGRVRLNGVDTPTANSDATPKDYVDNLVKSVSSGGAGEVYSEEETVIGTWLGKPLYQRVFTGTITKGDSADTGSDEVSDTMVYQNVATIIYQTGFMLLSNGIAVSLPWHIAYNDQDYLVTKADGNMYFRGSKTSYDATYQIAAKYTKTTD